MKKIEKPWSTNGADDQAKKYEGAQTAKFAFSYFQIVGYTFEWRWNCSMVEIY